MAGTIGAAHSGPGLTGDVQGWVDALTDWSIDLGFDTVFRVSSETSNLGRVLLRFTCRVLLLGCGLDAEHAQYRISKEHLFPPSLLTSRGLY